MKKIFPIIFFFNFILVFSQNENSGKKFIQFMFTEKNFEKAYQLFSTDIKEKITFEKFCKTANQLEKQLGSFVNILEIKKENNLYYFYSEFEKSSLDIKLNFDNKNKINAIFFSPHTNKNQSLDLENQLDIQSDGIKIKGTLLLPKNDTLKKLVIFIHGSGPQDRDESVYDNKPFKNIADRLLEKGIASYRYDKRTYSNPESLKEKSNVDDEITNDVLNIVSYFKNKNQFSNFEITLLGHSIGAYLLPKIVNKTNQISKIILLAANARPLDKVIKEQFDYLYKINPTIELKNEILKVNKQIKFLNSKSFNLNVKKEKLPFNLSPYYWKSILEYKPVLEVLKVKIPILILQGERDYQVTMIDFEIWKEVLKKNKLAKFKSYPDLNHLFMYGVNKSIPNEYKIKGEVDVNMTNDLIEFILKSN